MRVTVSAPDLSLPVEAQGHLRLDAPSGRTLELVADGDTLTLEVPTWADLNGLSPSALRARLATARNLSAVLSTCALTLKLTTRDRVFLELGANVKPSWFSRLIRIGPVRFRSPLIGLFFRR